MQAKGTTVKALKDYITETHGSEGCRRWLESLPPASQAVFAQGLLPSRWYPFEDAMQQPLVAMGRMFYGGNSDGAWQEGRYTAETNLRGVYRVFIKVASPQSLVKNTASLWRSYYDGSTARVLESNGNGAVLLLQDIEPACAEFDHHVAGWIERALEICGSSRTGFTITNPAKRATRYDITWQ